VRSRTRVFFLVMVLALATLAPVGTSGASTSGGTSVMGRSILSESELLAWWNANVPSTTCNKFTSSGCAEWVPYEFRAGDGSVTPRQLIRIYLEEGARQGLAGDIAFMQAILETSRFYFPDSGQVRPSDNNFAGMGAFDGQDGRFVFEFPDVRRGVRAQIQHLRIYSDPSVNTTGTNLGVSLVNNVDATPTWNYPDRWRWVRNNSNPSGEPYHASALIWEDFGNGRWATDKNYSSKILNLYRQALVFNGYSADAATQKVWHLRNSNTGGGANSYAYLGTAGSQFLACDWNGNGRDTPGVFKDGVWQISNNRNGSPPYTTFNYGRRGDFPLCGDWNGNGRETVGIVRDGTWHLRNSLSGGSSNIEFKYGRITRGDIPIVGDWNGNGIATPGIIRDREWHLRNSHSGGPGQTVFIYGRLTRGDLPLVGDWNGDGRDSPGIVREREWHLRNSRSGGNSNISFIYGRVTAGDVPLMGDWNGNGIDTPAIIR
jgi:hypothetical protein